MFANRFGEYENVWCGLVRETREERDDDDEDYDDYDEEEPVRTPVPLISVDVNASVVHAVAQVEVTQVYVNKEDKPIEAIYYFPVNSEGAVTHFRAELEGRVIKGMVKPHEEAQEDYDNAVKNQTTAFLGEETKGDIFKVRVGFLKPGTQVKVIIGYVTEVKNEPGSNAIRFYIPTTIAPRYVSQSETRATAKTKDVKNMTFSASSPAPLSLKVAVSLQGGINCIESPTHKITIQKLGSVPGNGLVCQDAIVQLSGATTDMDRDFVLNIMPEEPHQPRMYSEKAADGSTAVMVHLVPSFKLDEQKTELIFVLDRSGSMSGQSIELAKKALLLFLHSMPADCYFNIVGFGSRHKFLFSKSVKYNDGSLKTAISHAKNLKADLGGTEIMEPLQDIYRKPGINGYLRQLFILTDGEVDDTDGVMGVVQANANKARVFTLGIGDGASHHLVEGVARAGGGTAAFVTYKESIDKKVLNQLKNGLQPSLTDIELEWKGLGMLPVVATDEEAVWNKQSPKRIPPVYDGSQMLVFGMFKDCPSSVTIKAQSPDGPLELPLDYAPENDNDRKGMLHRLAAIKLVRELELEIAALDFQQDDNDDDDEDVDEARERLKKDIVEIACKNGISSKYTSFVAVDEKDDKTSSENWVMETRNVPSQYAHGWGGGVACASSKRRTPAAGSCSMRRRKAKAPAASKRRKAVPAASKRRKAKAPSASKKRKAVPAGSKKRKAKAPTTSAKKRKTTASSSKSKGASAKKSKGTAKRGKSKKPQKKATQPTRKSSRLASKAAAVSVSSDSDEDMDVDASDDEMSSMMQLIELQSFDGSYTLSLKLTAIVAGKSVLQAKNGATQHKLTEKVFATALAISYFLYKVGGEKDKWELIVKKARKWLGNSLKAKEVDAAIAAAKTFIGA